MNSKYFGLLCLLATVVSLAYSDCVPRENKNFHYGNCTDHPIRGPIRVVKIEATQNGRSVEREGGLDLNKRLTMKFTLDNKYKKEGIKDHRFDFYPYQYDEDDDGNCDWISLDFSGMTEDVDACESIHENCHYKDRPKDVTVQVDFPKWNKEVESSGFGSLSDILSPGSYYQFEIVDRDGPTKLNCVLIQMKIK